MPRRPEGPFTPTEVRAVALAAGCDERTVRRYLRGEQAMLDATRRAVEGALREAGHGELVREKGRGRVER